MKNIFLIVVIALLAVSCGPKGSAKTNFKIFSGAIIDPAVTFPGGLLVMGRSLDNTQSFILPYNSTLELTLQKGNWEFASIGWKGLNPMEGAQECAYQQANITTDSFSLTFNMTYANCLNTKTAQANYFSAPQYYNNTLSANGIPVGFKTLNVTECLPAMLGSCAAPVMPTSFKIDVLPHLQGISTTAAIGFSSNCVNPTAGAAATALSNLTPPWGGPTGFIGMRITTFTGANCSGIAKDYIFDHGFGNYLNNTFVDVNGVTQTRRGAPSTDPAAMFPILTQFNFLGTTATAPGTTTPGNLGDMYFVPVVSPGIPGVYYVLTGAMPPSSYTWTGMADGLSVKLFLEQ